MGCLGEAERIARGNPKQPSDDASEPPNSTEPPELAGEETWVLLMPTGEGTFEGARVLPIPIGEGTSKAMMAVSVEPIIIIFQEFSSVITGSPGSPLP